MSDSTPDPKKKPTSRKPAAKKVVSESAPPEKVVQKVVKVVEPAPIIETELVGAVRGIGPAGDLAARLMEAGVKPPPDFNPGIKVTAGAKPLPVNIPAPGVGVAKSQPFNHARVEQPVFNATSVVTESNPSRLPAPRLTPDANPVLVPVMIATPEKAMAPASSGVAKLKVAINALQQASNMTPDVNLRAEITKVLKQLHSMYNQFNGAEKSA